MGKRTFLSVVVVPAAAAALLGGIPAAASAVTAAPGKAVSGDTAQGTTPHGSKGNTAHGNTARDNTAPGSRAFQPLTQALAARLARNASDPVIVILKSQLSPATGSGAAPSPSAAVTAAQASLAAELQQVDATGVKRFTLVNSVAATVSALEARRLAADPTVAAVIPDATFSVTDPSSGPLTQAPDAVLQSVPSPARSVSLPLHAVPGACAARGKSQLAPEGLALTSTASSNRAAPTARSLGFTGAGVKVGYIADGLDPDNANFRRKSGKSVFTSYQDFTGNGPSAPTAGGEAFLDANTIAGQGIKTYNVNGFGAQDYPGSCDVKIQGVAPGASLVGLDVFSGDGEDQLATTTSMFAQAINYAVETAKVNVLNESFGSNDLPDTAQDVIRRFDDAAVKAGVVVSVSSGDAGTASTIGSPATDPNVISVGAATQFQALAQANIGGARYFARKGWLSDNISSFSSAGFTETAGTVDLAAPGDLSWASCDANTARYSECTNDQGNASDIEQAGGTSESAPFVSGAAALVIQAFRKTHHGRTPSPLQVKQILESTATDLGTPAQEQGAGLLDSDRAVQLAQSYGISARTGSTLLASPGQLTEVALPGTAKTWKVTLTNEGRAAQTVRIDSRTLKPGSTSSASGSVTLSDAKSSQYVADSGGRVNYATFKFRVPAHQGRLSVSIAYPGGPSGLQSPPVVALFDPDGRMAADSEPQGGGNYGNVDVRGPAGGTWTGVVSSDLASDYGYVGRVTWHTATQNYTAFGSVSPASLTLAPGQAKSVVVAVRTPSSPGDLAGSILLHSVPKHGRANPVTSIPVVVRSEVNVAAGGRFTGVLTGGNGRGALGTADYYQFTVPSGTKAVRAELALHSNPGAGNPVGTYLVSPDGDVIGYGQNSDLSGGQLGITDQTLTATALKPAAGAWTLIVAFGEPVSGAAVTDPYTGYVTFAAAGTLVPKSPLPHGTTLVHGKAVTIPVTITNKSNAPQDYFLDPRLDKTSTLTLAPLDYGARAAFANSSGAITLPVSVYSVLPFYFVPSGTSAVMLRQASTRVAMTDLSPSAGDPDVGPGGLTRGSLCGKSVRVAYAPSGGTVTSGSWITGPTECGPYGSAARAATATDTVSVTTAGFDPAVAVATGDLERLAVTASDGNTALGKAVELQPGKSAKVNVTFKTAAGAPASLVSGTLYLDTVQGEVPPYGQGAGDEVAALPYSYRP
jgi:Subtilase family